MKISDIETPLGSPGQSAGSGDSRMTTPWTVDVTETGVYLCAGVEDVAEFRHSGRHGAAISQEEAVANATLAAAAGGLLAALKLAVRVADEASEEWDNAPSGMRAGKLLIALSGRLKGYRPDIDSIHAAIAAATRKLP